MLLFFIRHGDPVYHPDQLTPLGRRQAEAVAKRLALYGVDEIYSSTSTRAMQTAEPTAEILKLPIEPLHWCHETLAHKDTLLRNPQGDAHWCWTFPEVVRLFNTNEIREMGKKWYDHPYFAEHRDRFKNGLERVERETYAWLATLGYEHDAEQNGYFARRKRNDRIALFAHEGFGKMFFSALLDIPYPMFSTRFEMSHTGMTVIEFTENKDGMVYPRVLQFSNDSHLYREGIPTNYKNMFRF